MSALTEAWERFAVVESKIRERFEARDYRSVETEGLAMEYEYLERVLRRLTPKEQPHDK